MNRDDRDIDSDDLEYGPGNTDYEYDDARQRLVDARIEGRVAGRKGLSVEMNPYYTFEAEHTHWHDGWREGLTQHVKLRAA